jgi:hypothetical protein
MPFARPPLRVQGRRSLAIDREHSSRPSAGYQRASRGKRYYAGGRVFIATMADKVYAEGPFVLEAQNGGRDEVVINDQTVGYVP